MWSPDGRTAKTLPDMLLENRSEKLLSMAIFISSSFGFLHIKAFFFCHHYNRFPEMRAGLPSLAKWIIQRPQKPATSKFCNNLHKFYIKTEQILSRDGNMVTVSADIPIRRGNNDNHFNGIFTAAGCQSGIDHHLFADIGSHPRQRLDRCAKRHRHLRLHPFDVSAQSDPHGGRLQLFRRLRHDDDQCDGRIDDLQHGGFRRKFPYGIDRSVCCAFRHRSMGDGRLGILAFPPAKATH